MTRNAVRRGPEAVFLLLAALAAAPGCIERVLDAGVDGGPMGIDAANRTDSSPGDAGGTDADAGPPLPGLEVGTGNAAFISAPDGADVEVHQGPQGGFHVYVSLRVANILPGDPTLPPSDPAQPTTRVIATDAVGTVLADLTLTFPYAPVDGMDGTYELIGWAEVLQICACAIVAGDPLTITGIVTDSAGTTVTDARTWMVVESPECQPPVPPCSI